MTKTCDTLNHPSGILMCAEGTEATTYVVYRWSNEDAYVQESLCDTCAGDIRHGASTGELVLVWCASLSDAGLKLPEPSYPSSYDGQPEEACYCRRCMKDDPGGCLEAEKVWQSQVDRGIITSDEFFIAKDTNGVAL